MELIDKAAVVAEIEKLIDEIYAGRPFDSLSSEQQTALWYVKSIMSSIDTLEVKEVDLEKELKEFLRQYYNYDYPKQYQEGTGSNTMPHIVETAKYFFNLGLKAQKGEEI